jgi:uncharacterized damage-inducible protein DinB
MTLGVCTGVLSATDDCKVGYGTRRNWNSSRTLPFRAREAVELIAVVEKYDEAALAGLHSYKTTSGMPQSQVLSDILLHLFNHQTHHRGQAHACLSILTGGEPPSLDLLAFQRGGTAPNLETLMSHNGK